MVFHGFFTKSTHMREFKKDVRLRFGYDLLEPIDSDPRHLAVFKDVMEQENIECMQYAWLVRDAS